MKQQSMREGFTIVELLVVLSIIGILTAVLVANLADARASSRDKQRIAEVEQISLALTVYNQAYGEYPDAAGTVGEGGAIDDALDPFMGTVPDDPSSTSGSEYSYEYDDAFDCDGNDSVVIYAATMEKEANQNGIAECPDSGVDAAYIKVLGPAS